MPPVVEQRFGTDGRYVELGAVPFSDGKADRLVCDAWRKNYRQSSDLACRRASAIRYDRAIITCAGQLDIRQRQCRRRPSRQVGSTELPLVAQRRRPTSGYAEAGAHPEDIRGGDRLRRDERGNRNCIREIGNSVSVPVVGIVYFDNPICEIGPACIGKSVDECGATNITRPRAIKRSA